jgi:hypothetical protein
MKELPFFKFNVNEWLLGTIADENYRVKGLFIDACAYYWKRSCDVNLKEFCRKLGKKNIETLEKLSFLRYEDDKVMIDFLDEEYAQLSDLQRKRVEGGRKGGLSSAQGKLQAQLKDTSSNLDIDKDKEEDILLVESKDSPVAEKKPKVSPKHKKQKVLPLNAHIKKKYPNVARLKDQLTEEQIETIKSKYGNDLVKDILDKMDNWKPLNKKNVSVYRTITNWAEREIERNPGKWKKTDDYENETPEEKRQRLIKLGHAIN